MRAPFGKESETHFEKQLGVVKNEIFTRYRNDPFGRTKELLIEELYPFPHPYANRTAGDKADLGHITFEKLVSFGKKYYQPGNCVLVIAGDIEIESARDFVDRYFGFLFPGPQLARHCHWPIGLLTEKELVVRGPHPVELMLMAWPSCKMMSRDEGAYYVLSDILSSTENGLLTKRLVHKGLALEVSSEQASF